MAIAIFDFDGTLITRDSFIMFALHSVKWTGLLKGILRSFPWLLAWKLGFMDGGKAKEHLFYKLFRGLPIKTFHEYCVSFADRIKGVERKNLIERLKFHLNRNDKVFIVSASFPDWIIPWARMHGVTEEYIIGTGIEADDFGLLTGRFSTPNCNGEEKVKRLKEMVPYLSDYYIYVYGDSSGDRFLMALADRPFYI